MKAEILENVNLKGEYYQIRFASPEVAADAKPGQFVHVRIDERRDFMLRRPFSIKDAENGVVTLLYKVVGKGTAALSSMKKGSFCDLLGPQGSQSIFCGCGDGRTHGHHGRGDEHFIFINLHCKVAACCVCESSFPHEFCYCCHFFSFIDIRFKHFVSSVNFLYFKIIIFLL